MSVETKLFDTHYKNCISKTWNYAKRCKTENDHICNAVLGFAGEAGEVSDQVKKWLYHTEKAGDHHREKLVSELGDVLYYMIKFMKLTGITVDECIEANVQKLQSRHPELGKVKERFSDGYIK
jgi:NTP pyrophosphatase (non-canonical NTP hydrolase)